MPVRYLPVVLDYSYVPVPYECMRDVKISTSYSGKELE
jgi:hypothetical protein